MDTRGLMAETLAERTRNKVGMLLNLVEESEAKTLGLLVVLQGESDELAGL